MATVAATSSIASSATATSSATCSSFNLSPPQFQPLRHPLFAPLPSLSTASRCHFPFTSLTPSLALHASNTSPRTDSYDEVQEMSVYEINENDRDSPAYLPFSLKIDFPSLLPSGALGDLLPYTNKLYDGTLQMRLGITAGICVLIRFVPEKNGHRYEAIFSFYLGDYGHISVQGPYLTYEDCDLAVTGGSGLFTGVYGTVRLHTVTYPSKIFYTFYLRGIGKLPEELTREPVPPSRGVRPSRAAQRASPGATSPNYTD